MFGISTHKLTIALNGTKTNAIPFADSGRALLAIITPTALTGTSLSMEVAFDRSAVEPADADFVPVIAQGWPLTVAVDGCYIIPPDSRIRAPYIRLVSDAAEAADRTLVVVMGEGVA